MKNFHFSFLLLICFYINNIEAVVAISLGGCCTIASVLRETGLRRAAYPFDWMFSTFDAVYKSIEDDFRLFLDPATLKVADDRRIVLNAYGIQFVHDFPTIHHPAALNDSETHEWAEIRADWRNFIEPIREKYQRRIERLRAALSGSDHVFLIRYGISKSERDQVIMLRDLLIKRYPNSNFTIVAVGGNQEQGENWGLEKIKNFYVVYGGPDFWPAWRKIFDLLGINQITSRNLFGCGEEDDWVYDETCGASELFMNRITLMDNYLSNS
jgi:hypothetical protein